MLLIGFKNPPAGRYAIKVAAETGPNGALETGTGQVEILPATRPRISVTSLFFLPKGFDAIYQETNSGLETLRPYDFLLWDKDGKALENVTIAGNKLMQGDATVGQITIQAPAGAEGQMVRAVAPSKVKKAPLFGIPTGHLRVAFRAGSKPGDYSAKFQMNGGTSQTMFVQVK
jgi:hypothetical protein